MDFLNKLKEKYKKEIEKNGNKEVELYGYCLSYKYSLDSLKNSIFYILDHSPFAKGSKAYLRIVEPQKFFLDLSKHTNLKSKIFKSNKKTGKRTKATIAINGGDNTNIKLKLFENKEDMLKSYQEDYKILKEIFELYESEFRKHKKEMFDNAANSYLNLKEG